MDKKREKKGENTPRGSGDSSIVPNNMAMRCTSTERVTGLLQETGGLLRSIMRRYYKDDIMDRRRRPGDMTRRLSKGPGTFLYGAGVGN